MPNKPAPEQCDICHGPIDEWFVDGKTRFGPWGDMCKQCFGMYGIGLGTGKGQKYDARTGEKIAG